MGRAEQGMTEPNPFTSFEYYAYADQFYDAFYKLGADHLHPSALPERSNSSPVSYTHLTLPTIYSV